MAAGRTARERESAAPRLLKAVVCSSTSVLSDGTADVEDDGRDARVHTLDPRQLSENLYAGGERERPTVGGHFRYRRIEETRDDSNLSISAPHELCSVSTRFRLKSSFRPLSQVFHLAH